MNAPTSTATVPDAQPQRTSLSFENTSHSATRYRHRIITTAGPPSFVDAKGPFARRLLASTMQNRHDEISIHSTLPVSLACVDQVRKVPCAEMHVCELSPSLFQGRAA